jgi:hypothetical protein
MAIGGGGGVAYIESAKRSRHHLFCAWVKVDGAGTLDGRRQRDSAMDALHVAMEAPGPGDRYGPAHPAKHRRLVVAKTIEGEAPNPQPQLLYLMMTTTSRSSDHFNCGWKEAHDDYENSERP